jgi:hypothetical protein
MTEHQICAPTLHELTPGTDPSGSAEELALAALQRRIETNQVADELLPIADDEITTRDASRFTLNSRHDAAFFRTRFPNQLRYDKAGQRAFAYPRAMIETYMANYKTAEPLPAEYGGRTVSSFTTERQPLAIVFDVINELEIPVRIYKITQKQRSEFIDEDDAELLELGLSERPGVEIADDSSWAPPSPQELLNGRDMPERIKRYADVPDEYWDDDSIRVGNIHVQPLPPAWLHKPTSANAPTWQPRYLKTLVPLEGESIPLSELGDAHNALVILAAHHPELVERAAIGLDAQGQPAITAAYYELFLQWLSESATQELHIPNNWQSLEDVARDVNITLKGIDGLERWVDDGQYGSEHIAVVPYMDGRNMQRLTFCSPQLARMITDRVLVERQRLERVIELAEKYGANESELLESATPEPVVEETISAKEELRAKLQPLEAFGAMHAINPEWTYELVGAQGDAYAVDYTAGDQKHYAYFGTTEGVEHIIQNLAPADYRTARQICSTYGLPLYLFDDYADGIDALDSYLSSDVSANTELMPHYSAEQVTYILKNYYDDVADQPMTIAEIAAASGQTSHLVCDYLERHGVIINDDRSVLRRAGLKYIREYASVPSADETQTPTLFIMRTREARNSDLSHTEVTAMCYELGIEITVCYNPGSRRTTQHIPTDRLPELQAAVQRYYERYKRKAN